MTLVSFDDVKRFHMLHLNCKKCRRPIIGKAAWDCPQEWIDKLAPMVTCNPCYDRMEAERKARDLSYKRSILTSRRRAARESQED